MEKRIKNTSVLYYLIVFVFLLIAISVAVFYIANWNVSRIKNYASLEEQFSIPIRTYMYYFSSMLIVLTIILYFIKKNTNNFQIKLAAKFGFYLMLALDSFFLMFCLYW